LNQAWWKIKLCISSSFFTTNAGEQKLGILIGERERCGSFRRRWINGERPSLKM